MIEFDPLKEGVDIDLHYSLVRQQLDHLLAVWIRQAQPFALKTFDIGGERKKTQTFKPLATVLQREYLGLCADQQTEANIRELLVVYADDQSTAETVSSIIFNRTITADFADELVSFESAVLHFHHNTNTIVISSLPPGLCFIIDGRPEQANGGHGPFIRLDAINNSAIIVYDGRFDFIWPSAADFVDWRSDNLYFDQALTTDLSEKVAIIEAINARIDGFADIDVVYPSESI